MTWHGLYPFIDGCPRGPFRAAHPSLRSVKTGFLSITEYYTGDRSSPGWWVQGGGPVCDQWWTRARQLVLRRHQRWCEPLDDGDTRAHNGHDVNTSTSSSSSSQLPGSDHPNTAPTDVYNNVQHGLSDDLFLSIFNLEYLDSTDNTNSICVTCQAKCQKSSAWL